jgi:hypothetical protein
MSIQYLLFWIEVILCQEEQEKKVKQVRNHIHLLMKEGNKPIGNTFRRIGASPKKITNRDGSVLLTK